MDNQQKFQNLLEDENLQQAMKRAQDNISAILMRRFMENNVGNNQQLPTSSTSAAQTSSHFGGIAIAHNSQASTSQCVLANIQIAQASSTSSSFDSGISQNQSFSESFTPASSSQTTPSFHPLGNISNPSTTQAIPYFLQNTDSELAAPAENYSTNFQEFPLLNARLDLNSSNPTTNNTPPPILSPPIPKIRLQHRNGQWRNQNLIGWRKNPEVQRLVMNYIQWAAKNRNSTGGLKMLTERIEALLNVDNLYRSVNCLVCDTRAKLKSNINRHKKSASASNTQNSVQPMIAMNPTAHLCFATNSFNSQNCGQPAQIEPITNMNVSTNTNLQYSGQQFQVPQITAMNSTANLFLGATMSKNLQNCQQQQMQSNSQITLNTEQLNNLVRNKLNNLVRNRNAEKNKQIGPLITIDSDDSETEESTSQAIINTFSPGMARDCNLAQLEQTISQQMNVFDQQKNVFDGQGSAVEQFLSSNFELAKATTPQTCQTSEEVEANTSVVSNSNGSLKENNAAEIMKEIQKEIQIATENAQNEVEIEQEEQHSEAIANEVEAETETVPYFEEARKETGGEQQKSKEDEFPYKIAELLTKEEKLSQNEEAAEQIDKEFQNMRGNNSESGEENPTTSNVEATIENAQNPLEHSIAEQQQPTAEGTRRQIKSGPQIWMRRSSHKIVNQNTDTKVFHHPPPVRLIPKRPKVRVIVENISTVLATIGKKKMKTEIQPNVESQDQIENSAKLPLKDLQTTSNTNAPKQHQKRRKCSECNIKLSHKDKWAYHLLAKHGIFVNQNKLVIDYLRGMDKKRMGQIVWRCHVCKSAKKKSDFATASQLAEHFELEKHTFNHSTKKYIIEDVLTICEGKKL